MAQISTAISDLVLSITCFYGAGVLVRRYIHASAGLIVIGIAAGVGTTRFLNIAPLRRRNAVISLHTRLGWFATILGTPLIAASFCIKNRSTYGSQLHIISSIAGIILSILLPKFKDAFTHFASTLAILSILFQGFQTENVSALAGAVLYIVSGTVIGTSGYIMGYLRVDVFHYLLVVANIALVRAL